MKPGIPWSVKGIGPEAREAAKIAARRSGLTLGEWLNTMILEQGTAENVLEHGISAHPDKAVQDQLNTLSEQIRRLTSRDAEETGEPYEDLQEGSLRLEDIFERLDTNERYTVEALTAFNSKLEALAETVDSAQSTAPSQSSDTESDYKTLESALRNVVDHIEVSERRTRDTLRSVQDRVSELVHKAAQAAEEEPDETTPRFETLERQLTELGQRLNRLEENDAQQEIQNYLEAQIAELREHINAQRISAEHFAQKAEKSAVSATRNEFQAVNKRLETLHEQCQAALRHAAASSADFGKVRAEIGGLDQRIDDIKAQAASERDLHAVRLTIEQLTTRIAQAPDYRSVAELDRRFVELARRLEQMPRQEDVHPHISALEHRIDELDRRLEEAALSGYDRDAFAGLNDHIVAANHRLQMVEERLNEIATFEHSINQLFHSLEDNRDYARQVAEAAAEKAVGQVRDLAISPAPSREVAALESALEALRAQAQHADQQTQETLEAVHDTLEHIVNKLAELEDSQRTGASVRGLSPAVEYAQRPSPLADTSPTNVETAEGEEIQTGSHDWHTAVQHHLAHASEDPDEEVAETSEHPVETAPPSKLDFMVQPEGLVQFEKPLPVAEREEDISDDYIAAARLAAHSAEEMSPSEVTGHTASNGADPKAHRKRWGLSLPFFSRQPARPRIVQGAPTKVVVAGGAPTKDAEAKRKRLIIAGLLILAAVSAYTLHGVYDSYTKVDPTTAPIQRPPAKSPLSRLELPSLSRLQALITSFITPQESDDLITGSLPNSKDVLSPPRTGVSGMTVYKETAERLPRAPEDLAAALGDALPPAIGTDILREAALKGDPAAQFVVAQRFLNGQMVLPSLFDAFKWYRKAAEQGLAPAQYRLGTLYERGKGTHENTVEARHWYELAARQGNVRAMYNLAVLVSKATSNAPDYKTAASWFRLAADYGLKDSQFNLAILCERGLGVPEDLVEAYFWFSAAAAQGDEEAAKRAQAIEGRLPLVLLHDVKARLNDWRAKGLDAKANAILSPNPSWQAGTTLS